MKLEKCYKKLLMENPFYGLFLLGLSKAEDKSIPTACVRKKGIGCELAVNPDYWDTLSDELQLSVLQHEVYHIVFHHMFLWDLFPNKELLNLATDCEVNSYIEKLDPSWITPSLWNLPIKKGTKFYYEELSKNNNKNSTQNSNNSTQDDHSKWSEDFGNCSTAEKQLIENQIDRQIKAAAEQTIKMRGIIPGELQSKIGKLLQPNPRIFDWKSYFRRMLGDIYDINIKKTRRKESIRFPESSGIKHKKKVSILVAVDTSGSVNNKELQEFFSEIYHIYKIGARVTILECDSKISANYEYKGKWDGTIHGRGGTNFQPVIDFYREHHRDYSSLIYFTDGECSLPKNTPKDTIWVITSNGAKKEYPGKTLYIPKNN